MSRGRIAFIDDEPQLCEAAEDWLSVSGFTVTTYQNPVKAMREIDPQDCDCVVSDLRMPGASGFDVLTRWKQDLDTRRVPVIILSARSTEADKVRGLDLGAEDYITKPFSIRKLKSRINAALRRVVPAATRMDLGALALEPNNRGVTYLGRPVALTQQEFELLHYMAARAGQLLKDVWGYESETDASRTVDYHIRSLRRKLGDDAASPRLIETVHGSGYRLITPA